MAVWTLGINHNTAPLDLRGRFTIGGEQVGAALDGLRKRLTRKPEAALISTCNRTEVYCAADLAEPEATLDWMAECGGVAVSQLRAHCYALHDMSAARHVFRVASGLDSMVLGEPQILGQVKEAVRSAQEAGALGTTLSQLFQRSFAVAKEVRSSTAIGTQSISMAAASVRLAGQLFENLRDVRVLFVGAGEMIELCAAHFASKQPKGITVANRTLERAATLASRHGGSVMQLAELPDRLHEFDAVISCTASTLPIIGLGAIERALKRRRHRPMFMVDLAVPRDIEPEAQALQDVYLYTVDDLAGVVQTGHANRQAAVAQAEVIIDAGVQSFMQWIAQRGSVPLIQQLNAQADEWRAAEIQRAQRLLAKGENIDAVLEALSKGLTQKMLHGALAELRSVDLDARAVASSAVQQFFLRSER